MSEFAHPLWPETPATVDRSHGRRIDRLERRSHGPWHNAGDPDQPILDPNGAGITPASGYINDVGARWRRKLGGGVEPQVAVDGGADGDIVVTLPPGYFLPGEGKIPLEGHDSTGALRPFYADSDTGDIVCGPTGTVATSLEEHLHQVSQTIAASSTGFVSWSRYAGGNFLDLTDPTKLRVTTKGLYLATARFEIGLPGGSTTGDGIDMALGVVQFAGPAWPPSTDGSFAATYSQPRDAILGFSGAGAVSAILGLDGGQADYISLGIANRTGGDITVNYAGISVIKALDI